MQRRAFLIIATGPVAAFPELPFCKGEPFSRILCGFVPGGDEFVLLAVADANAVGLELMPVCRVGLTWQASPVSSFALSAGSAYQPAVSAGGQSAVCPVVLNRRHAGILQLSDN